MTVTAEGVREWPILMTGPLVLASLEDRKTETRRVPVARWKNLQVGDRLWVRETWRYEAHNGKNVVVYRADDDPCGCCAWRPSIFMPRWACRLVLEVVAHRVERLHEITDEAARVEGVEPGNTPAVDIDINGEVWAGAYRRAFREGWDRLNAARGYGWDTNPMVKVIQYRRVK